MLLSALAVPFLCHQTLAGEVYRWRDAQGTTHFADAPPAYQADVTRLDSSFSRSPRRPTNSRQPLTNVPSLGSPPAAAGSRGTSGTRLNIGRGSRAASSRLSRSTEDTATDEETGMAGNDSGLSLHDTGDELAVPSLDSALSDQAGRRQRRPPSRYRLPPMPVPPPDGFAQPDDAAEP